MKRIIIFLTFVATQLACFAQSNPKIESLYAYLKAKGIAKHYMLSNSGKGLFKGFSVLVNIYDESPAPIFLYPGKALDAKEDSVMREKWRNQREALNYIRRTLYDLSEDAAESYIYEYHQNGHDTIIADMGFKSLVDANRVIVHYKPGDTIKRVIHSPETVFFSYNDIPATGVGSRHIGSGCLSITTLVDTSCCATKDFDIDAFQKTIAPLLKDKSIKRHTIHCRYDKSFDIIPYSQSLPWEESFTGTFGRQSYCDSQLTICKFTSEEQAKKVLHQILECARQHIADHPKVNYNICSDAYFPPTNKQLIFMGGNLDDFMVTPTRTIAIRSYVDFEGFYISINVWKGDECTPYEWKTLKSFVNGKKTYYKDKL